MAEYEEDKKQIEKELAELAEKNALKASMIPSECGYISPLLGKTRKNITTGFYGYSGHTGVDFAIKSGINVIASCHGESINDIKNKKYFIDNLFDNYFVLSKCGEFSLVDRLILWGFC